MSDSTSNNPSFDDEAHVYRNHNVEAALRQATSLVNVTHRRLMTRHLTLSAAEAATLHAYLEELELLVGALRWQIQEQQAGETG